jgi:CRP-like cAMP-binding protein
MTLLNVSSDEDVPGHQLSYLRNLRSVLLFSDLSDVEIAHFHDAAQGRAYKKGKVLYVEEEGAEFFYVICSGWVKLFHTTREGDEVILDMLTNGHLAGESALFEKDKHTSSAQVVEDVQLLSIPLRVLKDRIANSQTMALSMLSAMFLHHRRHYGEMALNATQKAPQRVGSFLLRLCPRDKTTGVVFHLPYDKTLIADTLGMKGETFSRALNVLRLKTGLRIKGTSVEIGRVDKLIEFVYGSLDTTRSREDEMERGT